MSSVISRSQDKTMVCFHACLNELPSELCGFAFKGTDLITVYSLRSHWEFCRYSEGFYFCFIGLSRSTYKLCGKHMQTKKISHSCSHPCSCCEFASGRIIRWGKKPWGDTNIEVLVISQYKASQDSAIVSGLLTDLRSCFCVLTMRTAWQRSVWGLLWNSKLILNQLEDPVEDILLVSFYSVSTQVISQEMDWSDHCFGLSN